MNWDKTYEDDKLVWGKEPSELAAFACKHLSAVYSTDKAIKMLDLGCGYGRDTLFLARNTGCDILGIDNSRKAIAMARKNAGETGLKIKFRCCDFRETADGKFEVIFASNLYQLLNKEDREALRGLIRKTLKNDGMFFLSTLSTNDPEHYKKGKQVLNDENSFIDEKFLHFCTREELEKNFSFLTIKELYEHEYHEPRSNGETHHHISWLFLGINPLQ